MYVLWRVSKHGNGHERNARKTPILKDKHMPTLPKINFKNRNSRKDKRRKNVFDETIQGDFNLAMDCCFDNSTGDYNHLWSEFINTLGEPKVMRKKFQKFLQNYLDEIMKDTDEDRFPKEI